VRPDGFVTPTAHHDLEKFRNGVAYLRRVFPLFTIPVINMGVVAFDYLRIKFLDQLIRHVPSPERF
jgi:hypothetical protein